MNRISSLLLAIVLVQFIGRSSALCGNDCSGHGSCSTDGKYICTCYNGYEGPDCRSVTCPKGLAWTGLADSIDGVHSMQVTCSNAGTCNSLTGVCACLPGFGGSACNIMTCPVADGAACGGRGLCLTMRQAALGYDGFRLTHPSVLYSQWDADRIYGCVCDSAWSGHACENRLCPYGDDPETGGQTPESQIVSCTCAGTCAGAFALSFGGRVRRVLWNAVATTAEETGSRGSGYGSGESLQSIMNSMMATPVVTSVTFASGSVMCAASGNVATIVFTRSLGDAPGMIIKTGTLESTAGFPVVATGTTVPGTTERVLCSNRGICSTSNGTCACMDGYQASDGNGNTGNINDCGYRPVLNAASCPTPLVNNVTCSGKGTCSVATNYACICYQGFTGTACERRSCPTGSAWWDEATQDDVAHADTECSSKGSCDYATGVCKCDAGFTGAACDRTSCPTDSSLRPCNGQGRCVPLRQMAETSTLGGALRGAVEVQAIDCNATGGTFTLTLNSLSSTTIDVVTGTSTSLVTALQGIPGIGVLSARYTNSGTSVCSGLGSRTLVTFSTLTGNVPMLVPVSSATGGTVIVSEVQTGSRVTYGSVEGAVSTWDADMLYGCVCDGYPNYNKSTSTGDAADWSGADCSLRTCNYGIDPVGDPTCPTTYAPEVQRITCMASSGYFTLSFRGSETDTIPYSSSKAQVQALLEALPSIGRLSLTSSDFTVCTGNVGGATMDITFESEPGDVPALQVVKFELPAGNVSVSTRSEGTGELQMCSGRGTCDTSTALCNCFSGFVTSNGYGKRGKRGDCGAQVMEMLINP